MVLIPEVLNGVDEFLHCVTPIWRWHFCFIKLLLVDSFGLRLYSAAALRDGGIVTWCRRQQTSHIDAARRQAT